MQNIKVISGIGKQSKKPYECLQVVIGDYSTLIFPTKIEMMYIKTILKRQAHQEFRDSDESELDDTEVAAE